MPSPLVLIALLLASPHATRTVSVAQRSQIAGWTLDVAVDRFTGGRGCRLFRPGIHYERQALVFHLTARTDTTAAVYRIDGGAPIATRDDRSDLARLGFLLDGDALDNPSGGLVRVPEARLATAATIWIAPRPGGRPLLYDLGGFAAAHARAEQSGCTPATFTDPGRRIGRWRSRPAARHRPVPKP